jgi:hypothetical protein
MSSSEQIDQQIEASIVRDIAQTTRLVKRTMIDETN